MSAAVQEEAQKKNTDCVYFLASPLTCKKGSECEFRHSESARNNPRDCWYWLSGACLNANCAFRHPPLEGLPEGEVAAGGKSRVPCYYFLQGYCVKGDKCPFMHGLPSASATETSQKTLKSIAAKTGEVLDNQTSANRGNGSITSKNSLEYSKALTGMHPQKSNPVQDADAHVANALPEGSDSSTPVRPRLPQDNEQVSAINDRLHPVHPSENDFLHQEAQTEDETLCDFQPGDDAFGGQDPSGEDRMHNGTESEELWEESSFDVLVDDGGTDQLIYADDLDYLNQYDAIVDHLTGVRGADGFVDFDYEHAGTYGQYYDAGGEYEIATYDAYEQQLVYEHLSSFDPEDGMHPVIALSNRQANMLPRDRREASFAGEGRPGNVGSNDLRNHIAKRRRAEKNQDDYHRRRHQGSNGSQHSRRHQDGHSKQQDRLARRHISPQTGSRSNRQYQGRGEPSGGRQFHGRLGEPLGTKRPYRDTPSSHEETSVERGSGKKFRGMNDTFKARGKPERGRTAAFRADDALESRDQQPSSKKAEMSKDDSSFAGPKTLAQIKAEKMKAIEERGSSQQQGSQGEFNGGAKCQISQMRSKSSQGLTTELPLKELGKASKAGVGFKEEADFEGPKPLSVILKQKRREDGNGVVREQIHEKTLQAEGDMEAVLNVVKAGLKSSSSVRDSINSAPYASTYLCTNQESKRSGNIRGADSTELGLKTQGELLENNREVLADKQSGRLERDTDRGLDTDGVGGVGDNSGLEDGDFEDDEDDDDFAKKLGGFFS